MNTRHYVIGTGYCPSERYDAELFANHWITHVERHLDPAQIFVMSHGVEMPEAYQLSRRTVMVPSVNLGHVHQYVGAAKPMKTGQLCGWSASTLALALIAYNCEADFVYVEQDALVFGDVVSQIRKEATERQYSMMFGSCKKMNVAQSLFWVDWNFIPLYVSRYLDLWPDTDPRRRPEGKFKHLESTQAKIGRFSFGCDRDRPLPIDQPVWYAQQLTRDEMILLHSKKLLLP